MIALGPREVGKALAFAVAFGGLLHMVLQSIAGIVQCDAWGTCPW